MTKPENQNAYRNQALVAVAGGLAGMAMLHAMNFATFGLPSMERDSSLNLSKEQSTAVVSMMPAFAILGNILAGALVETFGRKFTICLGVTSYVVGWVQLAVSNSVTQIMVSRAVLGIGGSFLILPSILLVSECGHPNNNGRLQGIRRLFVSFGTLIAFISGSLTDWRGMSWVALISMSPLLVFVALIPESPLYLVRTGKVMEAQLALEWLRDTKVDAKVECKGLIECTNRSSTTNNGLSFSDLLKYKNIHPIMVCLALVTLRQCTGFMAITTFAVKLFEDGQTTVSPSVCAVMVAVTSCVTSLAAGEVHTHFDRKSTLGVSSMFIVNIHACIGAYFFALESDGQLKEWALTHSSFLVTCVIMFYVAAEIGPACIPLMYWGEGLPSHLRGVGSAIGSAANTLSILISILIFRTGIDSIGYHYTFFALAALTALSAIVSCSVMIETRGKSVQDIDVIHKIMDRSSKTKVN